MTGLGNRKRPIAMRAILILGFALGGIAWPGHGALFVVNSTGDDSDVFPGDGVAETIPGSGITTLRAAIEEANAFPGPDTIIFSLGIQLKKALPPLADPTGGTTITGEGAVLDGNTLDPGLPGYSQTSGIRIESAGNVVAGLGIYNFPLDGIQIAGPAATGNTVRRSFIGMRETMRLGNGRHGIAITDGASGNLIGGENRGDRNQIADNSGVGVLISGAGTDGNRVLWNAIGTSVLSPPDCALELLLLGPDDPVDLSAVFACSEQLDRQLCINVSFPNRSGNVRIAGGAADNTIGDMGAGNLIGGAGYAPPPPCGQYVHPEYCTVDPQIRPVSAGNQSGVVIEGEGTSGNAVRASHIGFRQYWILRALGGGGFELVEGVFRSGMGANSVRIQDAASGNTIGGLVAGEGNTINYSYDSAILIAGAGTEGNAVLGNSVAGESTGVAINGGATGNFVGSGGGGGNVIRSRGYGVEISGVGTIDNLILGNAIAGNGFSGVALHGGAAMNRIGGESEGEGNQISGNCSDGIIFFGPGTAANQLLGNDIYGNGEIGVFLVNGASNNIIGGSTPGAGNEIHDNAVTGVEIHDAGTTGNRILGNDIHGNGTRGVFLVDGTSGNIVGGEPLAERNRIYDNELSGIEVNGVLTVENKIRINSIYNNGEKGIRLNFGANQNIQPPAIERFVPFTGTATPGSFVDAFADTAEEGRTYIGTVVVDESGQFSVLLNLTPHRNLNLTATATDLDGNTSEFSLPVPIIAPTFPETSLDRVIVVGDDLELAVAVAGSPEIALQWQFRADGGAFAALEEANGFSGVTSETLALENGQAIHEGYYRCVADNGLGAVNSREIFVRVVPADLNELQVNALADTSDGDTSSFGRLLASPGADGAVSLREAIIAANTMPGDNTIRFAVEGAIAVESPLPAISDNTGALLLEGGGVLALDGSALAGSGSGLTLNSSGNRIAGLGIYNFPEHGLAITGSDNTVVNCAVGRDGDTLKPNGANGILLSGGASGNDIGGAEEGDGNIIDGNGNAGIMITGVGTSENRVLGNTIGDPAGDDGGNSLAGVLITSRAKDNVVGGALPAEGNTIAGNTGIGVYVTGAGTSGNTIRNNAIFNNGDLGIRLFEGGNDNIARPVVLSMGPVTGTAPAASLVDGYLDAAEEGETPLFTVMADGDGHFTFGEDLSAYDGVYLTVTATDAAGNTSAFSLPFPIDFTHPELALNGPPVVTLECGEAWADPGASAYDNFDGDITANVTATLLDGDGDAGAVESASPGEYTLTYTVSDASGLAAEPVSRAVTIEDTTPPVLSLNGAETIELTCGTPWEDPGALAVDACEGDLAVTVTGTVDTARAGAYTLTYTAEDGADNAAPPLTRTVTVLDAGKPEITLTGESDLTVACGEPFIDPGATALDACEGEVAVNRTGMVDVARIGLYVLTYNAADSAGNAADPVTRSVTVADGAAPLLVLNGDAEVTITCGQGYVEEGATLTDACDPGAEVTISGDFNPNVAGIYTRFYDAMDGSGNRAETLTRTITVLGGSAPSIFLTGEATVTVPCNTAYQDAGARAVDGCQTDITGDIVVDNPVDTSRPGAYTVTYNVMDATGAAATPVARTVTVLPCVAPCDDACAGEADDAIDADGDGLSRCKERCLGTSDSNPDTDGDGMPDGFEYEHGFNALADDGDGDADLDGFSNTDEFLAQSLPRDSNSPLRTFFVSPLGVNLPEAGTRAKPWQSIGYAMNRISPSAANPVRLFLDAGVYVEDVTVKSHAELRNAAGADVEIMGTVVLRANSTLQGITCTSDAAGTGIVFVEGGIATVRDCTINGEFGENLTGIVIETQSSPRSVIEGTLFQNLDTGIDISGALPAVRRCAFANIAIAAILVRDGTTIASTDSQMGHGFNGWNDFGVAGAGLAIRNETGAVLSAQWNDWGTDSAAARQELVEGTVNQGNALAVGTADDAAALEIVVSNGANQARLANAAVAVSGPGGAMNATTGADGRVTLPVLPAGTWRVAVTASGFPDGDESVTLQPGTRRVAHIVLIKEDTDPTPEPPGGCPAPGKAASERGDLVLFGLLLACLAIGKTAAVRRRE